MDIITPAFLALVLGIVIVLMTRQRQTIRELQRELNFMGRQKIGDEFMISSLKDDLAAEMRDTRESSETHNQVLWQNSHLIGFLDKDRTYQMYLDAVKARDEAIQAFNAGEQGIVEVTESYENHILGLNENIGRLKGDVSDLREQITAARAYCPDVAHYLDNRDEYEEATKDDDTPGD